MKEQQLPKYMQLKQEIISWIGAGQYKPGDQLPSENEITEQFQISRQTVRQALGELVQEGWLYRMHGKGTFIAERTLTTESSADLPKTIGLITTYISDYIFPSIVRGVESTLRERGYRLLLSSTDNQKEKERESLDMMMSQAISGLIIEPTKSAEGNPNYHYYLSLDNRRIPYLMINERYGDLECPYLKLDDEAGGDLAAEHLLGLGHRRIMGLFKTDDLQGVQRMKGFVRAHRRLGLEVSPHGVHRYSTEDKYEGPKNALRHALASEEPPTALVCYNDELAVHLLDVIREKGLKVPEDISIVGFDDSSYATATEVKLTTVSHPKAELGVQAAEMMLSMIEHGKISIDRAIFPPTLVIRESTIRA
ncbi:GntR family transcriptional regulator [Marinicrinis lubricantis]|uniref:GntR family transcriptional regulator n=1 Tax=Marinicrinis lubricantis TaxID=2086470 RepID=A0ABW1IKP4_9BACL